MTDRDDARNGDVGHRFRTLRQEDADGAPRFGATLEAAHARHAPTPRRRRLALGVAALLVGALVLSVERMRPRRPPIDLAAVHLRTPTDFLLRLPGADLLRSVPALGGLNLPDTRLLTTPIDRRTP
jgi:hypothetical protein